MNFFTSMLHTDIDI